MLHLKQFISLESLTGSRCSFSQHGMFIILKPELLQKKWHSVVVRCNAVCILVNDFHADRGNIIIHDGIQLE